MTTETRNPVTIIAEERRNLLQVLHEANPTDPTLCEGWQTRHMVAHLLLRESQVITTLGIVVPFLAERTERKTAELAETLRERPAYERAITEFGLLPGYFNLRRRKPEADRAINLIEYFVHIEDVRRACHGWEPRELHSDTREYIWKDLCSRARMMAGKNYPDGLVLEVPGDYPLVHTVLTPKPGKVATVLSGLPEELALYLFGREQAQVIVR